MTAAAVMAVVSSGRAWGAWGPSDEPVVSRRWAGEGVEEEEDEEKEEEEKAGAPDIFAVGAAAALSASAVSEEVPADEALVEITVEAEITLAPSIAAGIKLFFSDDLRGGGRGPLPRSVSVPLPAAPSVDKEVDPAVPEVLCSEGGPRMRRAAATEPVRGSALVFSFINRLSGPPLPPVGEEEDATPPLVADVAGDTGLTREWYETTPLPPPPS